jgi:hypothetical protein
VYRLFEYEDDFKWKNFELQNCRSHRNLQFSYKVYLHPSLCKKVTIFENKLKTEISIRKLRSGYYLDYLTMKLISNGKTLNYKIVDLVESYNFHIKFISIRVQQKNKNFENRLDPYRRGPRRWETL